MPPVQPVGAPDLREAVVAPRVTRPRVLTVFLVVLGFLGALDLARPYAGPGLKPWQWAAGAVAIALLSLVLRDRGLRFPEALPPLALAAFLMPTYVDHSRDLESDGIHYYSFLRSAIFDHDLDLRNDYVALGYANPDFKNVLPVGAPILWSPFVLVAHLAAEGARLFGAEPPTGVEPIYQGAACLATLAYGAAGLFLLMGALARWLPPAAAFWTTVVCWIGSPLRFYLSVLPGLAHGVEFFAAVLVLRSYLALRDRPDRAHAAWAGAACGLAFLTRSQDGLFLLLPGTELALGFLRGPERRGRVASLLALAGVFVVVALPQLAVWQTMFGTPVLIPHKVIHGEGFLHPEQPQLAATLISPRGGLFASYPMMLVAGLGLVLLAVRDPRYVAAVLPPAVGGWYVNSMVFDWYQVRRFTGLVPFLAPGLGRVLSPLARAGVVAMALAAFLTLRYDLAVDALRSNPGEAVPVRAAAGELADGLARDAYRLLEPRAPRIAVALLGAYTGEALLAEPVTRLSLAGEPPVLRLPERARHLSAPAVEEGVACRWVRGREARLFMPSVWEGPVTVTVRARALETLEPQAIEALWNDTPLERHDTAPAWQDYRFHVPAKAVRRGTNVLVLRFDRGPIYRRVRGEGPHEVRPAALASITLHRTPE